jgi:prevent-host-death family protein
MSSVTVTEARAAFPEVLERVRAGHDVTLTRHGHVVAVIVRPDRLAARRETAVVRQAAQLGELLAAARSASSRPGLALTAARAEELVAEVRRSREAR